MALWRGRRCIAIFKCAWTGLRRKWRRPVSEPKGPVSGFVIALPDGDQTPEQLSIGGECTRRSNKSERGTPGTELPCSFPTLSERSTRGLGNTRDWRAE